MMITRELLLNTTQEAGGRVTDIWGSDDNILFAGNVLAANPALHRFFLELNA